MLHMYRNYWILLHDWDSKAQFQCRQQSQQSLVLLLLYKKRGKIKKCMRAVSPFYNFCTPLARLPVLFFLNNPDRELLNSPA